MNGRVPGEISPLRIQRPSYAPMESQMPTGVAGVIPVPPPIAPGPAPGPVAPIMGPVRARRRAFRAGYAILGLLLGLPLLCAVGIAGYFRLSSAARALQGSVMDAVPGQWEKQFAVNVGGFTFGLVRFGSRFVHLPPEPAAALEALHGAEVGVYQLRDGPVAPNYSSMLAAADKSMKRRGWDRIVGVFQGRQFVAVYAPRKVRRLEKVACCVVVLNERNLVVVSARGNLEPLMGLATQRLHDATARHG